MMTASLNYFMVNSVKQHTIAIKSSNLIASARLVAAECSTYLGENNDYVALIGEEYSKKYRSRILVFDNNRIAVADSFNDSNIVGRQLQYAELLSALKGQSNSDVHKLPSGEWVMYATSPVISGGSIIGAVLISDDADHIFDLLVDIRVRILWLSLISLAAVSALGFWLTAKVTKPIIEVSRAANLVKQGELGLQVDIHTKDEVGRLASSFNAMSNRLNQVEQNRKKFFHNSSHELKTPLASAILLTDSMLYDIEKGHQPRYDFLNDIKDQLQRMEKLVQDLGTLALFDNSQNALVDVVELDCICKKVVATVKPMCKEKNLQLSLDIQSDVNYKVTGNADGLTDALLNLVENAVKYTLGGGKVAVLLEKNASDIGIRITDNGIGIPADDLDQVFERFYRVDKARSREQGGSGLGLSISREIIQAHGGHIKIASVYGKGTVVNIHLRALSEG